MHQTKRMLDQQLFLEDQDFSEVLFHSPYGSYFQQGACDPNAKSASASYFPDCTMGLNNNVTTGGIVQPTTTNAKLYEKSADLAVLFKPLFEAMPDAITVAMHFANSGAGSVVSYPGMTRADEVLGKHTSLGCGWMR